MIGLAGQCRARIASITDGARYAPEERGIDVSHDQKHIDELNEAKAAADAEDAKTHVTEADAKSTEEKLLAFASGLHPAERKHLFNILDKHHEQGGDVQGYWWHNTWRVRWWGGPGWRWWRR